MKTWHVEGLRMAPECNHVCALMGAGKCDILLVSIRGQENRLSGQFMAELQKKWFRNSVR